MVNEELAAPERNGNKAPDWGNRYGIRELWSEVAPGLFVGGTSDDDHVGLGRKFEDFTDSRGRQHFDIVQDAEITLDEFDAVVSMYAWSRPVDWGVEELRWGIMDSEEGGVDLVSLRETVVWAHRRWNAGKRVLVRCQAGLNRSSLVAGLVLVREGMEGHEAIRTIRRRRAHKALFNAKFERIVNGGLVDNEYWRN